MKGSVKLPVFIDDARKYVNTTQLRAKYLGASYEAEYCQWKALHGLGSLMETASLIITPNAYLEGKLIASYPPDPIGDLSVTRATTATRVNSAGLVELVPYNRFQYSEGFTNAIWSKVNTTITSGQTDPFGTSNASRYLNTANGGFILQSGGLVVNEVQTISAWVKSNTGSSQTFIFMANSGAEQSPTLTATNQWQRVTWTFTSSANNNVILFYNPSASLDLLIYGTQLVEGSTAKDYQKTETRLNIPRLDYSNGTCPSLLVEPQRTNLAIWSSSFDNAAWGLTGGVTITANNTISPSGVQDADRYIESTNANYAYEFVTDVSGTFTASLYVKKASSSTIGFGLVAGGFSGGMSVKFNLDTQTFSTPINYGNFSSITASYEALENGWYRLILTGTTATATSYYFVIGSLQESYAANTYIWGAQLEAGSYATSYIPTTSASVTRNADVISKTGISSLIGQTEGTVYADFVSTGSGTHEILGVTLTGGGSEYIALFSTSNGNLYFASNVLGLVLIDTNSYNKRYKIAYSFESGSHILYSNGNVITTSTSGSVYSLLNAVYLGSSAVGSGIELLEANAVSLWKTRIENAQLAQLTTI